MPGKTRNKQGYYLQGNYADRQPQEGCQFLNLQIWRRLEKLEKGYPVKDGDLCGLFFGKYRDFPEKKKLRNATFVILIHYVKEELPEMSQQYFSNQKVGAWKKFN